MIEKVNLMQEKSMTSKSCRWGPEEADRAQPRRPQIRRSPRAVVARPLAVELAVRRAIGDSRWSHSSRSCSRTCWGNEGDRWTECRTCARSTTTRSRMTPGRRLCSHCRRGTNRTSQTRSAAEWVGCRAAILASSSMRATGSTPIGSKSLFYFIIVNVIIIDL